MPRYRITIPDGSNNPQVVTINGVSIATENGFSPNSVLCLYATVAPGSGFPPGTQLKLLDKILGANIASFPTYNFGNPASGLTGYCRFQGTFTALNGQTLPFSSSFYNFVCGSSYLALCGSGSPVCNLLITDSQGAITRVDGVPGFGCPTVETLPDIDCQANEIKCDDPGSPQGFCCIPCDSLNSKIRALI